MLISHTYQEPLKPYLRLYLIPAYWTELGGWIGGGASWLAAISHSQLACSMHCKMAACVWCSVRAVSHKPFCCYSGWS